MKSKDWDDMLDTPSVFGAGGYSAEAPDGYATSVDEVMDQQDKDAIVKKEKEAKENKEKEERNKKLMQEKAE